MSDPTQIPGKPIKHWVIDADVIAETKDPATEIVEMLRDEYSRVTIGRNFADGLRVHFVLSVENARPGYETVTGYDVARRVLHYEEILNSLEALSGDPERALQKMRGHLGLLVVNARLALGLTPFELEPKPAAAEPEPEPVAPMPLHKESS